MKIFNFKKKSLPVQTEVARRNNSSIIDLVVDQRYLGVFNPRMATHNFLTLFEEISEVYFPVKAIADRVINGKFQLKKASDDSVVYDNEAINNFLARPNVFQSFNEFIQQIICYKLITGRAYVYGGVATERMAKERWKWCSTYVPLPSQYIFTDFTQSSSLLSATSINDVIMKYRYADGINNINLTPDNVLHIKDAGLKSTRSGIEGQSRLHAVKYPLSNLIEVYEARNAIYVKRGALGAIVSNKTDADGSVPLTPGEKEKLREEHQEIYGFSGDRHAVMITNVPVKFERFNLSIQELQPFEETLADAVQIAGVYNVPSVLIPRKDQSTFSNQADAERSLYMNAIIPEAQSLVMSLNNFLGLNESGLYLDVTFDHIAVLQPNWKEKAETNRIITETCQKNFFSGIITLNDWIAALGGNQVDEKIYKKYILQMNEDELEKINRILKGIQQGNNNSNNNQNDL